MRNSPDLLFILIIGGEKRIRTSGLTLIRRSLCQTELPHHSFYNVLSPTCLQRVDTIIDGTCKRTPCNLLVVIDLNHLSSSRSIRVTPMSSTSSTLTKMTSYLFHRFPSFMSFTIFAPFRKINSPTISELSIFVS